jgi:hypothetical protein
VSIYDYAVFKWPKGFVRIIWQAAKTHFCTDEAYVSGCYQGFPLGEARKLRMLVHEARMQARPIIGLSCFEGRLLLIAGVSLGLLSSALGQTDVQAEVGREVSRIQRPTLFPLVTGEGEEAVLAGELPQRKEYGQLRILYDSRPLPWLTAQIFSGAFYTTNAALLPDNEMDNWYFQQGFALLLSKGFLKSSLYPHASLYQAWFEYAEPGVQGIENFSAMDANVGLTYVIKKLGNLSLSVDYTYERLADLDLADEIFHENHLIVAANDIFAISRTHFVFAQAFADISLGTEPSSSARNDFGAFIGYGINWTPEITVNLSYRYAFQDYTEGPRSDNNHSFALSLIWGVRSWAFVRLSAIFVLNDSNIDAFNYNVFTGGPTASVNFQW